MWPKSGGGRRVGVAEEWVLQLNGSPHVDTRPPVYTDLQQHCAHSEKSIVKWTPPDPRLEVPTEFFSRVRYDPGGWSWCHFHPARSQKSDSRHDRNPQSRQGAWVKLVAEVPSGVLARSMASESSHTVATYEDVRNLNCIAGDECQLAWCPDCGPEPNREALYQ